MTSTPSTESREAPQRTQRYLTNVLWTWMGVVTSMLSAFLLQPYMIGKLGEVDVGIWTLAFSLVEYYWLIDLGFRSATTKMSAEFHALNQPSRLDELLSTGIVYSGIVAVVVIVLSVVLAPYAEKIWRVHRSVFAVLIMIAGVSWGLGMIFNIFSACIEGFQRFDLLGHIWVIQTAVRSTGVAIVLYMGHGLMYMGFVLLGTQLMAYAMMYVSFRRIAPAVRIAPRLASFSMLKEMISYGIHTFTTIISVRIMSQGMPVIIAYFLSPDAVTYYMTPQRIMDYAMDGIGRVGQVTTPNTTELAAKNRMKEIVQLGVYANRYCLCLFLPLLSFLLVYGLQVYKLWMWRRPGFAEASAYLIPIMAISHAAVSGQFNSVSILFGLGRHKAYSRCLLAESLITAGGMVYVLPHYGLYGGAILVSSAMIVDRMFVVCFLLCRELKVSFFGYLAKIYTVPLAIATVCTVFLLWLQRTIPGRTWGQIILAVTLMMIPYTALTFRFCLAEHHRDFFWNKLGLGRLKKPQAA